MQVKTKQKLFGALAHLVNSVETSMTAITSYERAVAYGRRARKFCVTLALLEYQYCKELIEDIAYSRVYLGHHYPSDNDGGRELGKAILKHRNNHE